MKEILLMLVIAYVFLAALLLLVLFYSRLSFWLKCLLTLVACGFYGLSYHTWQQAQGWPSHTQLPKRFLLHAAVIEEPNPKTIPKGRLFIWASDLKGNRPADTPRAYSLPYSKEVHSTLEDALRNLRNGNMQMGELKAENLIDQQNPLDRSRLGETRNKILFSDIPDPALPEK